MAQTPAARADSPTEEVKARKANNKKAKARKAKAKARKAKAKEQQEKANEANRKSPLFILPPELRNRIYEYAVVNTHSTIVINSSGSITRGVPPAILRTCRDIRSEALPIYFGDKIFTFRICPPTGCLYQLDLSKGLADYSMKMIIGNAESGFGKSTCCLDPEILTKARTFLNNHIAGVGMLAMDEALLHSLQDILLSKAWKTSASLARSRYK